MGFGLLGWTVTVALAITGFIFLKSRRRSQTPFVGALIWFVLFFTLIYALDGVEVMRLIGAFLLLILGGLIACFAAWNDPEMPSKKRGQNALAFTVASFLLASPLVVWGVVVHDGYEEREEHAMSNRTVTVDGREIDYKDDSSQDGASSSTPASGDKVVNASFAKPSLDCDEQSVKSWRQLVACVEQAPETQRETYIQYVDANEKALGTDWAGAKRLAKLEVSDKFDTRVILVLNSDVSENTARDLAHDAAGDAADKLPVTRTSGAIVNTRGGIGERFLEEWADGRSQVRVLLTVPDEFVTVSASGGTKFVGNTALARKGKGVEVECTNVTTGIVPKPTPQPGQGGDSTPTPKESTTPPSKTPTPTPSGSTTPPETTPPPATSTPPTTPPPSTTPPETTPPPTESTPPATTPPPSSPPPTSPTPTPSCSEGPTCYPKGDTPTDEDNEGKPPAASPSGDPDPTPKEETDPADPSDKPGDPAPSVEAPGATQEPSTEPTPDPETAAPAPTESTSEIPDPDAVGYSTDDPTMGYVAAALCGGLIASMAGIGRRRTRNR